VDGEPEVVKVVKRRLPTNRKPVPPGSYGRPPAGLQLPEGWAEQELPFDGIDADEPEPVPEP
jgi:hypothetical protein